MEKSKQDTFLPTSNLVHHLAEIHQKWLASFPPLHVQMALSENVLPSPKSKTRCSLDPPFWGPKCHLLSEYIHKISVPYWHIASLEIPSSKHCHGCGTSSSCKWFSWRFPHGGFHIYVSFLIKCPFIPLIPIKIQKSHWNRIKIPSKSYWNPKKNHSKNLFDPLWLGPRSQPSRPLQFPPHLRCVERCSVPPRQTRRRAHPDGQMALGGWATETEHGLVAEYVEIQQIFMEIFMESVLAKMMKIMKCQWDTTCFSWK